ncbi:MAG: hypothetical protein KU37_11240 [Sulfuricurvum sp. PC08-66]|nr:MAG: hypothetical protein KU37_11240 [Sulfuricurvum sp. PC08-66]
MTKLTLSAAFLASTLLFWGCAGKTEVLDETKTQEPTTVQEETAQSVAKEEVIQTEVEKLVEEKPVEAKPSIADIEATLGTIYFDYDKFAVRSDMRPILEKNSEIFKKAETQSYRIKVEGNCDEWGSDEYNYALGLKRAASVQEALKAEGISEERITLVSYGEANPLCADKTQECWSQNRRVDFKLLP